MGLISPICSGVSVRGYVLDLTNATGAGFINVQQLDVDGGFGG